MGVHVDFWWWSHGEMKVKLVIACFETQTEEFQNYTGGTEEPLTKTN